MLPRIPLQTCFHASLFQEALSSPAALDRYLRQQQAPLPATLHDQAVFARFDLAGRNCLRLRQHGKLDLDFDKFMRANRIEARILQRC